MNLDLINEVVKSVKEKEFVQNFMKELTNYLEDNDRLMVEEESEYNNLLADDLTLYNTKIITKFRDKMLLDRVNILRNYAEKAEQEGDMYYIYNNSSQKDSYNLCSCNKDKNHKVITKLIEDLPEGCKLGSVLRNKSNEFVLDKDGTKAVEKEINDMIKENIEEQNEYLENKRIEGHIYEVGEKYSGRVWLYDLSDNINAGKEGIEEIEFSNELYEDIKEGDKVIYQDGDYWKKQLEI